MALLNTLWTRLTLAFALVTNIRVSTEFRRFVHHNQMLESMLVPGLMNHYAAHDSWAGVNTVLDRPRGGGMGMSLLLADADGQVIYARGAEATQLTHHTALRTAQVNCYVKFGLCFYSFLYHQIRSS